MNEGHDEGRLRHCEAHEANSCVQILVWLCVRLKSPELRACTEAAAESLMVTFDIV